MSLISLYAVPEAGGAVGHMPLVKFQIVCFCPLMKRVVMGGVGSNYQNQSLFSYNNMFCPPPSCVLCPGIRFFLGGEGRIFFSHPDENVFASHLPKNLIMNLMNVIVDTPLDDTLLETPVFEFDQYIFNAILTPLSLQVDDAY